MASSDPRKIRPVPSSGEDGYDAEEDPLVELARIVSEDSSFSARRTERGRPRWPEPVARGPSPSELESELLRELESTFAQQPAKPAAPRPAPVAPQRPQQTVTPQPAPEPRPLQAFRAQATPAAAESPAPPATDTARPAPTSPARYQEQPADLVPPAAAADEQDSEELLRSIEEQLGQFERRARASLEPNVEDDFDRAFQALSQEPESPEEWRPRRARRSGEPEAPEDGDPVRAHPPAAEGGQTDYRFRGPARIHLREAPREPADEEPAPFAREPAARADTGRIAPAGRAEEPAVEPESALRPVRRDPPVVPLRFPREARGTLHEDDAVPAETSAHSDMRADVGPEVVDVEAEISREFEPRQAEAVAPGRRRQPAEARNGSVAAAREQIGRNGKAAPRKRRGAMRSALLTAASVIVVAAAGAAAAIYLRSAEDVPSGPPPVIAAPEGAVKVEAPEEQASAETETVGEAVYNRVAGNAPSTEERVVESAEEPREIARIVLPAQGEADAPLVRQVGEGTAPSAAAAAAPETQAAAEPEDSDDAIGPRRVQTFVVRPDGTVVSTEEAGGAADPVAAQQEQLAAQTEQIEPVPVATVTIGDTPDVSAPAPAAAPAQAAVAAAAEAPASELAPAPQLAPASEPQLAATEPAAPAASAAIPQPTGTAGGYVVQVSSQRSPEQAEASFADLQRRYGSVLGGLSSSIQRADLGERGIYYRVRVGPWADRAEAITVCEALKSAGGDCLVTQ